MAFKATGYLKINTNMISNVTQSLKDTGYVFDTLKPIKNPAYTSDLKVFLFDSCKLEYLNNPLYWAVLIPKLGQNVDERIVRIQTEEEAKYFLMYTVSDDLSTFQHPVIQIES